MHRLSIKHQLVYGERSFGELHLQRRMGRTRWWHLHSVRGRKVQGVDRIGRMHGLSVKLQLACGERSFDELHLQRRLIRDGWWRVRSVRGRKVQGVDRIGSVHEVWDRDVRESYRTNL
jgi:hypothetical protein